MKNVNITKSEWKVMKTLWEGPSLSSYEIMNALREETNWSITTVKTFLSRLEKKEVISFVASGRTYEYYPILSENECVNYEMLSTIKRVYGEKLIYKEGILKIYGHKDEYFTLKLWEYINLKYTEISRKYKYDENEDIIVYQYSSQKRLHNALGIHSDQSDIVVKYQWGVFHIAPPSCFATGEVEKLLEELILEQITSKINAKKRQPI